MPPILASLGKLKHEICESEDSSGYIERLFFKNQIFPHIPAILVEGQKRPQRKQNVSGDDQFWTLTYKKCSMHAGLQADSEDVQRLQSTRVHALQLLNFEKTETERHTRLAKAIAH